MRGVRAAVAFACAVLALLGAASPGAQEPDPGAREVSRAPAGADERAGRRLFVEGCSSCHGLDARGIPGRAPSLRGVGELAADFYLRTGRMPLNAPDEQPRRNDQDLYEEREVRQLVAYVGSFGGPGIPEVHPERGRVAEGLRLFSESCAGCHQIVARGGVVTKGRIPDLQDVEPVDVAEALHIGPYVMPNFRHLEEEQVNALAAYVEYARDPEDRGGWGIGHIGPIPEGMVTWLLAAVALLLTIRIIGERTTP